MIGRTLSHYRILERLGAGGMGIVYRARDTRLERDVAVKILPEGALADEAARRQFRKEALALSQLNHPNVETVHDFDRDEGVDFLVMELIPGRTLSDRIEEGPLPEEEVARLGEHLAEGLAAAHREGILHRDIKPGNIRVTPEGRLKILDFGLAKLTRLSESAATVTQTQSAAGTLPYMAPEQLRGGPIDNRCDVYAAGAVLYEMACGRRAFPQESGPGVVGAILGQPPASPREVLPGVSADLERVILRCLEKDPAHRYGSAEKLAEDLRQLGRLPDERRFTSSQRSSPVRVPRWASAAGALVAVTLLLLALNVGGVRDRLTGSGSEIRERSLAVLPLANLSKDPEQEYFADGMTDELITRLSQVGALRVISRSSAMQYKGAQKPARTIARELGVTMVLEGSVLRSGDRIRISAQLIDALSDRNVWAESYERSVRDVLALQSEVARAIVENVRVTLTPAERSRISESRPVNPAAHEEYLRGLFQLNRYSIGEGYRKARAHFSRCIELDPRYAPAWVGMANAYIYDSGGNLDAKEAMPRARAAAEKAIQLDSRSGQAHAVLGYVRAWHEWDWSGGLTYFRRALDLSPGDASVHQNFSVILIALGRFAEAEREIAKAKEIDPLSSLITSMTLWPLFEGRQYDRAISAARRLVAADPSVTGPHLILGQALVFQGNTAEGIPEIEKAVALDPNYAFFLGWLGYAYAVGGQRAKALDVLHRMETKNWETHVQPYSFALVHVGLGEHEKALTLLEETFQTRSDEIGFLKVDPGMDPLRSHPRFQAIIKGMKFPA